MRAYHKERFENAISFFAREHRKKTGKYPSQTHMYKYLALFDFQVLEERGRAPLDLTYLAMDRGPVPKEIYFERKELHSDYFAIENIEENKFIFKSTQKPDLDYFSQYEIDKMKELIYIFATNYVTTNIMSNASHEKIKAWEKAYRRSKNSVIKKSETFDKIFDKSEDELSPQEERFLISETLKRVGC